MSESTITTTNAPRFTVGDCLAIKSIFREFRVFGFEIVIYKIRHAKIRSIK
jgi:hypothetical protein